MLSLIKLEFVPFPGLSFFKNGLWICHASEGLGTQRQRNNPDVNLSSDAQREREREEKRGNADVVPYAKNSRSPNTLPAPNMAWPLLTHKAVSITITIHILVKVTLQRGEKKKRREGE